MSSHTSLPHLFPTWLQDCHLLRGLGDVLKGQAPPPLRVRGVLVVVVVVYAACP
jgi:hypothetical protein